MTTQPNENVFESLRESLKPKGTLAVVKLQFGDHSYVSSPLVTEVINELERKCMLIKMGIESPSAVDKLMLQLLFDSAGIGVSK